MHVVGVVLKMLNDTSDGALLGTLEPDGPALEESTKSSAATLETLRMLGIADNVGCADRRSWNAWEIGWRRRRQIREYR